MAQWSRPSWFFADLLVAALTYGRLAAKPRTWWSPAKSRWNLVLWAHLLY